MGRWSNVVRITPGPSLDRKELDRIFSNDIRGVFPYSADGAHIFLEFAEDDGAANALAFHNYLLPHIEVHAVDDDAALIEQYRIAVATANNQARIIEQQIRQASRGRTLPNHSAMDTTPPESASQPSAGPGVPSSSATVDYLGFETLGSLASSFSSNPTPALPHMSSAKTFPSPVIAFSMDDRVSVRFHDETFNYDMKSVKNDPQPIVELLKLCNGDPGTWMTAAAYYRRSGWPNNSIVVLMAMIESMKRLDIPEEKLRPVFLMLSGCESDMAKASKAHTVVDHGVVAQHYENSKKWLQKVYGTEIPHQDLVNSENVPARRTRGPQAVLAPIPEKNCATSQPPKPKTDSLQKNVTLWSRDDCENLPPPCTEPCRGPSQASLIAVQRAKRKLEDDCIHERELRRRLERELREVVHQRDIARQSEDRIRTLMREESEARKKAEAAVELERGLRKEMEKRTAAPLLKDLAQILQRAIQGEVDEVSHSKECR